MIFINLELSKWKISFPPVQAVWSFQIPYLWHIDRNIIKGVENTIVLMSNRPQIYVMVGFRKLGTNHFKTSYKNRLNIILNLLWKITATPSNPIIRNTKTKLKEIGVNENVVNQIVQQIYSNENIRIQKCSRDTKWNENIGNWIFLKKRRE